jgi:16S rRNA (adenine1518-N6/adenine1519-N6)-dimethyltransferase
LGQYFLADPNLARAIVADAGVGPTDRVVEIGAGLGSLTVPLADAAREVVAVEFDRALLPALDEVVGDRGNVRVLRADATRLRWAGAVEGDGWVLVANLPYNVSVPLVLGVLEDVPAIARATVMVQREVADRFVAAPGDDAYGPATVRVALRARASRRRSVAASVFWPRPRVGSAIVALDRIEPPSGVRPRDVIGVVEAAFAERRKTISNALASLTDAAREVVAEAGLDTAARAETIAPTGFVALARALEARGWSA